MENDAELLAATARGDRDAFEALYARHGAAVLRHVERLLGARDEAQDVAQETFLRVWRKSSQWENRGSAAGWIFSIATNLSLNQLQSRRCREDRLREDVLAGVADTAREGPAEALLRAERIRAVREGVGRLSEEKRVVLALYLDEGVTLREIAEKLDLPLGTVKSRMHYAWRLLREGLDMEGEGRES